MATVSFSTGACEIGLTHDETNTARPARALKFVVCSSVWVFVVASMQHIAKKSFGVITIWRFRSGYWRLDKSENVVNQGD